MHKYGYSFLLLLMLGLFSTCVDEPTFPLEPRIEFVSLFPEAVPQLENTMITLYFEDGDGDLGGDSIAIYIRDPRDESLTALYRVPEIPLENVSSSISGELIFPYTNCCIYDNGELPCRPSSVTTSQQVVFELFIEDRAGNQSNVLSLPPITFICQ